MSVALVVMLAAAAAAVVQKQNLRVAAGASASTASALGARLCSTCCNTPGLFSPRLLNSDKNS